ncbi:MAG: hypothetical protein ACXQTW_02540 [Candidatus Methanospirareceae archaeon]
MFEPEKFIKRQVDEVKETIGEGKAVIAASGGVVREENADCLVQGAIAADVAETVKGIKTQHNILEQIGIDPETYGLTIVEPLREMPIYMAL